MFGAISLREVVQQVEGLQEKLRNQKKQNQNFQTSSSFINIFSSTNENQKNTKVINQKVHACFFTYLQCSRKKKL